jgi:hypothetical protein
LNPTGGFLSESFKNFFGFFIIIKSVILFIINIFIFFDFIRLSSAVWIFNFLLLIGGILIFFFFIDLFFGKSGPFLYAVAVYGISYNSEIILTSNWEDVEELIINNNLRGK